MEPKIDPTVDTAFLQQVLSEIKAIQSLSEDRIRQIVREEIEETQKRQNLYIRSHGPHLGYEVK